MINKHQAATLWANGYRLVDKDGKEYKILCPTPEGFEIIDHTIMLYDWIGVDYFILARPLSDLTTEITHEGEKFVPLVELAKIEAGNHDLEDVCTTIEDEGYSYYIEYLPSWFGLYFNKKYCTFSRWDDGEGKDSCNNELKEQLHSWHFNIGFPEEAVKPLKD